MLNPARAEVSSCLALGVSLVPGSTLLMRILLLPVRVSAIVSLLPESSLKSCLLRTLNSYHRGKTSPAKIRIGLDLQPSDRLAFQASFIEFLLIDHEFDIFSDWLARDRGKAAPANTQITTKTTTTTTTNYCGIQQERHNSTQTNKQNNPGSLGIIYYISYMWNNCFNFCFL